MSTQIMIIPGFVFSVLRDFRQHDLGVVIRKLRNGLQPAEYVAPGVSLTNMIDEPIDGLGKGLALSFYPCELLVDTSVNRNCLATHTYKNICMEFLCQASVSVQNLVLAVFGDALSGQLEDTFPALPQALDLRRREARFEPFLELLPIEGLERGQESA